MSRVLVIIALVSLGTVGGVAGAAPANQVRVPVTISSNPVQDEPADSVVVEKGDHLWKISARHLGEGTPNTEIAPYWRDVIEVNTPHLRSGDPDLIYPGEVVQLPKRSAD